MFKASPEGPLEQRLRDHVRSRGYGPWVSVTTSEKGYYRQADVLAFLDRHLPKVDEERSRRWRIIMADDYSAHLSPAVFALCWTRRYVFIPHGGGVTPVVQTPDTDLNQHVKRAYTGRETGSPDAGWYRRAAVAAGGVYRHHGECVEQYGVAPQFC